MMMMLLPALLACKPPPDPATAAPRSVTFLAINDTYRIEGIPGAGGMARVAALRDTLTVADPELITVHAGDLLYPSLLSQMYGGEQMIDLLNRLDGDAEAFDPRLLVTFGNHEFDKDKLASLDGLTARVQQSQFDWISSNVQFIDAATGITGADNVKPTALLTAHGLTVGLLGLTLDKKQPEYVSGFADPIETARQQTAALRAAGADVVVGITHLDVRDDVALLQTLGDQGPDLLLGGHDHVAQWQEVGGRWVIKADADAVSATVVRLTVGPDGVTTDFRNVRLTGTEDPDTAARVSEWLENHEQAFCAERRQPPTCLSTPLSVANVELEAEELRIRRFETNLGDWVADRMLDSFAPEQGAQLAFINAGALRLNRNVPQGATLDEQFVEELFPYPTALKLMTISGATLGDILARAGEDWTGQGHWLQVAGLAFRYDPATGAATDLTLLTGKDAPRPVSPDETLRIVTVDYLAGGGDGYTMLKDAPLLVEGPALKDQVRAALQKAGSAGIAPVRQGRICNPQEAGPCLALPAKP